MIDNRTERQKARLGSTQTILRLLSKYPKETHHEIVLEAVKKSLRILQDQCAGDDCFTGHLDAVTILLASIARLKSVDLTKERFDAIRTAMKKIQNAIKTLDLPSEIDTLLLKVGLNMIPDIPE